jgi:putative flippase GtrA
MPVPVASTPSRRLLTFARSLVAGAGATLADMAVLALAVGALGLSPRIANVPALLVGATVQFFGSRHFAFRAGEGRLGRQLGWFAATEVVALLLNGVLYDLVAARLVLGMGGAVALRAAISFAVFALWSHPLWCRVFRPEVAGEVRAH